MMVDGRIVWDVDNEYFAGDDFHIRKEDVYAHVSRKRVAGWNRYRVYRGWYDGEWGERTYFSATSDKWARHYTFLLSRHLGWDGECVRLNADGSRTLIVASEETQHIMHEGILRDRLCYPLYLI